MDYMHVDEYSRTEIHSNNWHEQKLQTMQNNLKVWQVLLVAREQE